MNGTTQIWFCRTSQCRSDGIEGRAVEGKSIQQLKQQQYEAGKNRRTEEYVLLAKLKVCSRGRNLERGKQIHAEAIESGNHSSVYVATALVNMYAKCGSMDHARQVFDGINYPNVVSWTALILGYVMKGEGLTALELFERMKSVGCAPDSFACVAALKACTTLALKQDGSERSKFLEMGKQIHTEIGSHLNMYVQSTLLDMYAKCGSMVDAREVFDGIKSPDAVSWTALILGYAENGEGVTALEMFERMKLKGCVPDRITFVAALKSCSMLGALESGSKIHAEMNAKIESSEIVVTCLVDFYAKCGSLIEAQKVFDSHPVTRNLTSWNALLAGYGRLGDNEAVFGLFEQMLDTGLKPDSVTLLCILTCCCYAGLDGKANEIFVAMSTNYGISPAAEHYTCMLDILGRSNKLDEMIEMLRSMPCEPDAVTWTTVLDACQMWKNVEKGRLAFKSLVSLDNMNRTAYVLMAHIYGSRGMWEEQEMVLQMRRKFKA